MGTLAKTIGRLAAGSLESESANILKRGSANKRGLSLGLDTTLRTSHDMKIFGLGTAASMANHARYHRFTGSMFQIYQAMEHGLDNSESAAVRRVWDKLGADLRRAPALRLDLEEASQLMDKNSSGAEDILPITKATKAYVDAIESAAQGDNANGSGRLLGHLYCRYFADLFGGQALSGPYRWALGLGDESPRHFDFGDFGADRRNVRVLVTLLLCLQLCLPALCSYICVWNREIGSSGSLILSLDSRVCCTTSSYIGNPASHHRMHYSHSHQ